MKKTPIRRAFLSEQAVSERHGMGISIIRVLGKALDTFDQLVQLSEGGRNGWNPAPSVLDRTIEFPPPTYHPLLVRIARRLGADGFESDAGLTRRYAEGVVDTLARKFDLESSSWLVCPQGPATLYGIRRLKEIAGVRYATWVMDDHELAKRDGRWVYPWIDERIMERHLREADHIFVGSDHYGRFYCERFGVETTTLLAPCEVAGEPIWDDPAGGGRPRLAYFGAIFGWQLDPLEILAECAERGVIELDIYTYTTELPGTLRRNGVRLHGPLAHEAVARQMRKYSGVVVPLSFGERRAYMSHFNVPTKVAECLASGTLTVILGPPGGATVQLVAGAGAGLVITDADVDRVIQQLAALHDGPWRSETLAKARAFVGEQLSTARIHGVWRSGWGSVTALAQDMPGCGSDDN